MKRGVAQVVTQGEPQLRIDMKYEDTAQSRVGVILKKLGYEVSSSGDQSYNGEQRRRVFFGGDTKPRFMYDSPSHPEVQLLQNYPRPQIGSLIEGVKKGAAEFLKARGVDGLEVRVFSLGERVDKYNLNIQTAGSAIHRVDFLRARERIVVTLGNEQATEKNVRAVVELMEAVGKIAGEESQQLLSDQWRERVQPGIDALSKEQNDWAEKLLAA